MRLAGRRVNVRVPATSANLGPGFDTLGLALSLYDDLLVTAIDEPGVRVRVRGVGEADIATDETNLVASSLIQTFRAVGRPAPGILIDADNSIPHGRGMGSSGAAVVAGVAAAKGLLAGDVDLTEEQLLAIATEIEGHPDNVAPALFGGLTIAWMADSSPKHKKLMVHRGVSPLVLVPQTTQSTKSARLLQPSQVPHEDAVFNLSRAALLIAAMLQSPELLLPATEDRLHQGYRASAMPETVGLIAALRAEGYPAVVSGSGPSILVLCDGPGERQRAVQCAERHGGSQWQPQMLAVDVMGATVEAA